MAKTFREFEKMGVRAKEDLIDRLTLLGEDALRYAFDETFQKKPRPNPNNNPSVAKKPNAWTHRSYNLYDSFASAVYVDGQLREDTVRYLSPYPLSKSKTKNGRDTVNEYLRKIHPYRGRNVVTVIVVAAMIYTQYLESGRHRGGYKIKVIAPARKYIRDNWWRYVDGVYKRFNVTKPKVRVVAGDIRDTWFDYVSPNKD